VAADRKGSRYLWYGTSRPGCCVTCEGFRDDYSLFQSNPPARGIREKDAVFHSSALDLLLVSEFLSLHAPETPKTHHFINSKTIDLLPKGAILINTARGGLVVDEDLIAALKSGQVAAAGLDVFEGEPKLHPGYAALKNTFLTPHQGSATVETRSAMGMVALDNIDAVLAGKPAPSLVTKEPVVV
jgi:lactate dehydrogenase-like 2-hydroxyacid dehydrogenase